MYNKSTLINWLNLTILTRSPGFQWGKDWSRRSRLGRWHWMVIGGGDCRGGGAVAELDILRRHWWRSRTWLGWLSTGIEELINNWWTNIYIYIGGASGRTRVRAGLWLVHYGSGPFVTHKFSASCKKGFTCTNYHH